MGDPCQFAGVEWTLLLFGSFARFFVPPPFNFNPFLILLQGWSVFMLSLFIFFGDIIDLIT